MDDTSPNCAAVMGIHGGSVVLERLALMVFSQVMAFCGALSSACIHDQLDPDLDGRGFNSNNRGWFIPSDIQTATAPKQ